MTLDELTQLLKLIRGLWPNFVYNVEVVEAWYEMLQKEDYAQIRENVVSFAKKSEFPPKICDVLEVEVNWWRHRGTED
jgi:NDP-sugar pyrophosphorylase family protein